MAYTAASRRCSYRNRRLDPEVAKKPGGKKSATALRPTIAIAATPLS
jgi:hypothetical protein